MKGLEKEKIRTMTSTVLKDFSQKYPDLYFGHGVIEREVAKKLGFMIYEISPSHVKDFLELLVGVGTATKVNTYMKREGKVIKVPFYRYVL